MTKKRNVESFNLANTKSVVPDVLLVRTPTKSQWTEVFLKAEL